MIVAVVVVAVVGVGAAVLMALCASGRVPRNPYAGIRIPSLFASDEAWRVGHRAAVWPTAIGAVVCVVLAAIALALPSFTSTAVVLILIVLVVGVILGGVLARRAALTVPPPS